MGSYYLNCNLRGERERERHRKILAFASDFEWRKGSVWPKSPSLYFLCLSLYSPPFFLSLPKFFFLFLSPVFRSLQLFSWFFFQSHFFYGPPLFEIVFVISSPTSFLVTFLFCVFPSLNLNLFSL